MPRDWLRHPVRRELVQPVLSRALIRPVRSTQPSQQACRVAVEDRSAGFAHATELGAPTIAFALLKQRTTNTSARARSAEQPRTPGAFANECRVEPAASKEFRSKFRAYFGKLCDSN